MGKKEEDFQEVFIGLVAPLGCDIDPSVEKLEEHLEDKGFCVQRIKITDLILDRKELEKLDLPKSFIYYLKMELCSEIRFKKGKGYLAALAVTAIREAREKHPDNCEKRKSSLKIIYLIDQIKNEGEHALLSNLYDINYIQISFFSEEKRRNESLEQKFKNDSFISRTVLSKINKSIKKNAKKIIGDLGDFIKRKHNSYREKIRPDCSSRLIEKDFKELPFDISKEKLDSNNKSQEDLEEEKKERIKCGQQISKIFHKSHYFIDLDHLDKKDRQIEKFVEILFGKWKEYPTPEEFGMFLAAGAACRSNFPSDRQVGAAIIDQNGEVLACGSIRAPSASANPTREHMLIVEKSYKKAKEYAKNLEKNLDNIPPEHIKSKEEIKEFIGSVIEHFPFTHAEMSAISDAAKKGINIKGATLYTTTFPCHLCAKDIVTSGIQRVVFLEAYPKSKAKDLYLDLISIDSPYEDGRVIFDTFSGVGPRWYTDVYGIENKLKADQNKK